MWSRRGAMKSRPQGSRVRAAATNAGQEQRGLRNVAAEGQAPRLSWWPRLAIPMHLAPAQGASDRSAGRTR
eukprot:scaffold467_cov403-Prasinococcus_capsulatus_cf.AAC.9